MHTNSRSAFARGDRLTLEDMSLGEECRNIWLTVTANRMLRELLTRTPLRHIIYRVRRENERSDPLEALSRVIVVAAACGFPESTLQLFETHLAGVRARCFAGSAHRSLEELDLEETRLEAEENELALRRRIAGDAITPAELEHEATLNELEANVQLERSKELRRQARTTGRVLEFKRSFPRPMGVLT